MVFSGNSETGKNEQQKRNGEVPPMQRGGECVKYTSEVYGKTKMQIKSFEQQMVKNREELAQKQQLTVTRSQN